jgi:hypothetical protein
MNEFIKMMWQIISIIELLIILFLILKIKKERKDNLKMQNDLNGYKKSDINMNDLMQNMHLSKSLYKELSRKCHPDRFTDSQMQSIANELFQMVQQSKSNYKELIALKEMAINELKIKLS